MRAHAAHGDWRNACCSPPSVYRQRTQTQLVPLPLHCVPCMSPLEYSSEPGLRLDTHSVRLHVPGRRSCTQDRCWPVHRGALEAGACRVPSCDPDGRAQKPVILFADGVWRRSPPRAPAAMMTCVAAWRYMCIANCAASSASDPAV